MPGFEPLIVVPGRDDPAAWEAATASSGPTDGEIAVAVASTEALVLPPRWLPRAYADDPAAYQVASLPLGISTELPPAPLPVRPRWVEPGPTIWPILEELFPAIDDTGGFTIPNGNNTAYPFWWQKRWTETDIAILRQGAGLRNGVLQGCRVEAQGTPNFSVRLWGGTITLNGSTITVAESNHFPAAADPTNPCIELIMIDQQGHWFIQRGTPSADPYPPALPSGSEYVGVFMLTIPAAANAIYPGYLVDKRFLLTNTMDARHNYSVLSGHASNTSILPGSTVYGGFVGRFVPGATESDFELVLPRSGTLSQFRVVNGADSTPGDVLAYVRRNGMDTALSMQVAAFAGTYADTTRTVAVTAGDRISVKFVEDSFSGDVGPLRGISVLYDAP